MDHVLGQGNTLRFSCVGVELHPPFTNVRFDLIHHEQGNPDLTIATLTIPLQTPAQELPDLSDAVRTAAKVLKEVLAGAGSSLGPLLPQADEGE